MSIVFEPLPLQVTNYPSQKKCFEASIIAVSKHSTPVCLHHVSVRTNDSCNYSNQCKVIFKFNRRNLQLRKIPPSSFDDNRRRNVCDDVLFISNYERSFGDRNYFFLIEKNQYQQNKKIYFQEFTFFVSLLVDHLIYLFPFLS